MCTGIVNYLTEQDAVGFSFLRVPRTLHTDNRLQQSSGLIGVNSAGNVLMKVETTAKVSGNRKSVRIQSKNTFNGGLLVLDAVHMPAGCGTWPAWWSNGISKPVCRLPGYLHIPRT